MTTGQFPTIPVYTEPPAGTRGAVDSTRHPGCVGTSPRPLVSRESDYIFLEQVCLEVSRILSEIRLMLDLCGVLRICSYLLDKDYYMYRLYFSNIWPTWDLMTILPVGNVVKVRVEPGPDWRRTEADGRVREEKSKRYPAFG